MRDFTLAALVGLCLGTGGAMAAPPVAAAEEGGVRRWAVAPGGAEIYAAPDASTPASALAPGTLLDNRGCDAQGWCRVRRWPKGPSGFVQASALRPAPGHDGQIVYGKDDSAARARRGDFDATGTVACAVGPARALAPCAAAVARSGGGDATVRVTFPAGIKRLLFFQNGVFLRANTTMSGPGTDTDWRREGDRHVLRVETLRATLSHRLIFGD